MKKKNINNQLNEGVGTAGAIYKMVKISVVNSPKSKLHNILKELNISVFRLASPQIKCNELVGG